jgi:hypothetical protein
MLSKNQGTSSLGKAFTTVTRIRNTGRLSARHLHGLQWGTAQASSSRSNDHSEHASIPADLAGNPVVRDALVPIVIEQTVGIQDAHCALAVSMLLISAAMRLIGKRREKLRHLLSFAKRTGRLPWASMYRKTTACSVMHSVSS